MFNKRLIFSVLFLIFEIVFGIQPIELDHDVAKRDIFSMKHLNIPNSISKVLSHNNWTDNQNCLNELNAIQSGLVNNERWAIRGKPTRISNDLF